MTCETCYLAVKCYSCNIEQDCRNYISAWRCKKHAEYSFLDLTLTCFNLKLSPINQINSNVYHFPHTGLDLNSVSWKNYDFETRLGRNFTSL